MHLVNYWNVVIRNVYAGMKTSVVPTQQNVSGTKISVDK